MLNKPDVCFKKLIFVCYACKATNMAPKTEFQSLLRFIEVF